MTLLAGESSDELTDILLEAVKRKVELGQRMAFRSHTVFRGTRAGKQEYRDCYAAAPTAALAEALALDFLRQTPALANQPDVFSHRWPVRDDAARSYEYFVNGYDARTRHVGDLLSERSDRVAVIADVRSFYPSVSRERIMPRVGRVVGQLPEFSREFVLKALLGTMQLQNAGIPIGPALSPVLANLAFADVDITLRKRFGAGYTRYVDDMVVVASSERVEQTLEAIRNALDSEDLELNEDKTDVVSPGDWKEAPFLRERGPGRDEPITLEAVQNLIKSVLWAYPDAEPSLKAALNGNGLNFPLENLRAAHRQSRWQTYLRRALLARSRGARRIFDSLRQGANASIGDIVDAARSLGDSLRRELELAAEAFETSESDTLRRWAIRNLQRAGTGLLFVTPREDLSSVVEAMPDCGELAHLRAVIATLNDQRVGRMFPYPGAPIRLLAYLWQGLELPQSRMNLKLRSREFFESWVQLVLFGIVAPNSVREETLGQWDRTLYQVLSRKNHVRADWSDAYADELRAIMLDRYPSEVTEEIQIPYSDSEELGFNFGWLSS